MESDSDLLRKLARSPTLPQQQQRTSEESLSSIIQWESATVTPMTTRPHYSPNPLRRRNTTLADDTTTSTSLLIPRISPVRQKKVRSQSVGSSPKSNAQLNIPVLDGGALQTIHSGTALNESLNRGDSDSTPPSTATPSSIAITNNVNNNRPEANILVCILCSMINATIVLPVLMSFASIIYQDPAFDAYMPILVRLTVVSGIVHQAIFTLCSSLPFAVGQVQDAGLIFLSSMTTYIVEECRNQPADVLLATCTVVLAMATAVLGVALCAVGRFPHLTVWVQQLPSAVVAGYLAYIGWFCGMSGVRLMIPTSSLSGSSSSSSAGMERWLFCLPGVLGGAVIYTSVRYLKHMAVLPSCIMLQLVIFYVVLWLTDTSIKQVTADGWITASMESPTNIVDTWTYIRFDKVNWSVIPGLVLTELGMIFVVALSSSLDVAAIELELKRPLDYNKELTTVGISNLVSGLLGGYTGSYIFSQTIFTMRAGVRSRVAGLSLATFQVLVIVAPFPILSYIPNFFFGSLLVLICIDLMYEWLWDVRSRMGNVEYGLDVASFALIQWLGVEYGIFAGVVLFFVLKRLGLDVGTDQKCIPESSPLVETGENGNRGSEYGAA